MIPTANDEIIGLRSVTSPPNTARAATVLTASCNYSISLANSGANDLRTHNNPNSGGGGGFPGATEEKKLIREKRPLPPAERDCEARALPNSHLKPLPGPATFGKHLPNNHSFHFAVQTQLRDMGE